MATLTIRNVPDALARKLKAQAQRSHRSLNAEVILMLSSAIRPTPVDVETMLARARVIRAMAPDLKFTNRELNAWKRGVSAIDRPARRRA